MGLLGGLGTICKINNARLKTLGTLTIMTSKPFVGRQREQDDILNCLMSPASSAILVIGQQGFGKSALLRELPNRSAIRKLHLKFLSYEPTASESGESLCEYILTDIFSAAGLAEASFLKTDHNKKRWERLLSLLSALPGAGGLKNIKDLLAEVREERQRPSHVRLEQTLSVISSALGDDTTVVIGLDPVTDFHESVESVFSHLVGKLPTKIKLLISQRPEGILATGHTFKHMKSVFVPDFGNLGPMTDGEVECLAQSYGLRPHETNIMNVLRRYEGHPYAVEAAITLVLDDTPLCDFPPDPSRISETQYFRAAKYGEAAVKVIQAHAIFGEWATVDDIAHLSQMSSAAYDAVLGNDYIRGLFTINESTITSRRLYHSLLQQTICDRMTAQERQIAHRRVAEYLISLSTQNGADQVRVALQLPRHLEHSCSVEERSLTILQHVLPILQSWGRVHEVEQEVENLLALSPHPKTQARLLEARALGFLSISDLKRSIEDGHRAAKIAEDNNLPDIEARALGNLGWALIRINDLDRAQTEIVKSMDLHEELGNVCGVVACLGSLGTIHRIKGNREDQSSILKSAISLGEAARCLRELAPCYGDLAEIYAAENNLVEAIACEEKALALGNETETWTTSITSLLNLSSYNRRQGNISQALSRAREAESMSKKMESTWWEARALDQLAHAELRRFNRKGAFQAMHSAMHGFEQNGDERREIEALMFICDLLLETDDLNRLESSFAKIMAYGERHRLLWCIGFAQFGFAKLSVHRGKPDLAIKHFQAAMAAHRENGSLELVADSLKEISKVYCGNGLYRESVEAFKAGIQISPAVGRWGVILSRTLRNASKVELAEEVESFVPKNISEDFNRFMTVAMASAQETEKGLVIPFEISEKGEMIPVQEEIPQDVLRQMGLE